MGYRSRDLRPATGEVFGVNAAACLYSRAFLSAQPFGDEYLGFLRTGEYEKIGAMLHGRLLGVVSLPRFLRKRSVLGPTVWSPGIASGGLMAGPAARLEESGDQR